MNCHQFATEVEVVTLYKRGKYWYLDWYQNGKRNQQSTRTTQKDTAEKLRQKKEKELLLGKIISKELSIEELLSRYEKSVEAKYNPRTAPHLALIAIFILYKGLRRNEVFQLTWCNINLKLRKLRVQEGKGGKPRDIPLHPKALEAIEEFHRRFSKGSSKTGVVFHALKGTPLTRGKLYESFRRAGERAGLDGIIGVHTLRHTFATHLAMKNVPVRTLQEYMGHSDIQTTMIYLHLAESHWESEILKLDYNFKLH